MASVLTSNGFVYSNPLAKTFNAVSSVLASTESVRTNSLVWESSLKPLKKNLKQRKNLIYESI